MITLNDILNIIIPEYKIQENNKKIIVNNIDNYTNFDTDNNFTSLFMILLYILKDETKLNLEIDILKQFIENNNFNPLLNVKKINNLIYHDQLNNELILFLCGYFNINIMCYCYKTKILKCFYIEENFNINKKIVFIVLKNNSSPKIGFQTLIDKKCFHFNDEFIQNFINNNYMIPIGLIENKLFNISSNNQICDFILPNDNNIELIIDDKIFELNNIDLQDDEINNKFNIKKINKRFSRKKMLLELENIINK
jgi:hypothetical protein